MAISTKIKLASDLILTKLLCFLAVLFCLKLLFNEGKNNVEIDFKTDLEYKIFFIAFIGLLIYFLTRPKILYDDINLYIKKVYKKEMIIPLKNVTSFFENPFSANKGTAIFSIEFNDNSSENDSIKFLASYSSESIKNFKIVIRKINPHVEIV